MPQSKYKAGFVVIFGATHESLILMIPTHSTIVLYDKTLKKTALCVKYDFLYDEAIIQPLQNKNLLYM